MDVPGSCRLLTAGLTMELRRGETPNECIGYCCVGISMCGGTAGVGALNEVLMGRGNDTDGCKCCCGAGLHGAAEVLRDEWDIIGST